VIITIYGHMTRAGTPRISDYYHIWTYDSIYARAGTCSSYSTSSYSAITISHLYNSAVGLELTVRYGVRLGLGLTVRYGVRLGLGLTVRECGWDITHQSYISSLSSPSSPTATRGRVRVRGRVRGRTKSPHSDKK